MFARVLCPLIALVLLLGAAPLRAQSDDAPKKECPDKNALITRTYSVADLVIPVDNFACQKIAGQPAMKLRKAEKTLEDKLIALIQKSVKPTSWSEMGGQGTIQYFPLGMALVVTQTANVQEEIADLLRALRRLQNLEVAVECRVFSVPPATLKKICSEYKTAKGCRLGEQYLTQDELKKIFVSLQADKHADLLQAPKLTLFNGQTAMVNVTDYEKLATTMEIQQVREKLVATPTQELVPAGLKIGLETVVSADRKSVHMLVNANITELTPPSQVVHAFQRPAVTTMGVKVSAEVPDGRTMLVSGWDSIRHGRVMSSVLLVTPRIIVVEEAEQKAEQLPVFPHE
jgi:hypothetical protein